jgi:hypothetical protein
MKSDSGRWTIVAVQNALGGAAICFGVIFLLTACRPTDSPIVKFVNRMLEWTIAF